MSRPHFPAIAVSRFSRECVNPAREESIPGDVGGMETAIRIEWERTSIPRGIVIALSQVGIF